MRATKVNDRLTVATQPDTGEFAGLAAAGFGAVINNRPDGEEAGQPGSAAEAAAAKAAGLAYTHIPVTGASITEADVRRFQAAVAASDKPVLAHCKSGMRSLALYAIGEVLDGRLTASDLGALGERLGIDLRGAQAWLAHHGRG